MAYMIQINTYIFKSSCCAVNSARGGGGELPRHMKTKTFSLSVRILHRAPPPPSPSGPKFSNLENCCRSENAMPPKIFWDMEGHRGHFR